jgi:hypothetical protein
VNRSPRYSVQGALCNHRDLKDPPKTAYEHEVQIFSL